MKRSLKVDEDDLRPLPTGLLNDLGGGVLLVDADDLVLPRGGDENPLGESQDNYWNGTINKDDLPDYQGS